MGKTTTRFDPASRVPEPQVAMPLVCLDGGAAAYENSVFRMEDSVRGDHIPVAPNNVAALGHDKAQTSDRRLVLRGTWGLPSWAQNGGWMDG